MAEGPGPAPAWAGAASPGSREESQEATDSVGVGDLSERSESMTSASKGWDSFQLRKHITAGQHVLKRMQRGAATSMVMSGIILGIVYCWMSHSTAHFFRHHRCKQALADHAIGFVFAVCGCGRVICFSLAPLANDPQLLRFVVVVDVIFMLSAWVYFYLSEMNHVHNVANMTLCDYMDFFNNAMSLIIMLVLLFGLRIRDSLTLQRHLWRTLAVWLAVAMPSSMILAVRESMICNGVSVYFTYLLVMGLTLAAVSRTRTLHKAQMWLTTAFLDRSAERSAAGIAGLIGNVSPAAALTQASKRFRNIRVADLNLQDIMDNSPDPSLFGRSIPARLRGCDAFVSHSWQDDAEAKWAALARWRANFVAEHGREPTVWFDKCCIDQADIDADLRCLPVFLSGCRSLLVLCGKSYLSRLWCIMEIFTFVHMGGDVSKIVFMPVLCEGQEETDLASIDDGFTRFDVVDCDCFRASDKSKMLGIIHAAFGELDGFNEVVQAIFDKGGWQRDVTIRADFSTDDGEEPSSPESSCMGDWPWVPSKGGETEEEEDDELVDVERGVSVYTPTRMGMHGLSSHEGGQPLALLMHEPK